ncbi:MAG: hypothetical protein GY822_04655 [Deltaproteobacteria bacterium]|nr:hypothetical protein [Deltaproteobacteria bacterium]
MFVHLKERDVLGITPEQCVSVIKSLNVPNISIPDVGTEPTKSFIVGAQSPSGGFKIFIYMHHTDTQRVSIFTNDGPEVPLEQYANMENAAVEWVESLGFMLDNLSFHTLIPEQKKKLGDELIVFSTTPPELPLPDAVLGGELLDAAVVLEDSAALAPEDSAPLVKLLAMF